MTCNLPLEVASPRSIDAAHDRVSLGRRRHGELEAAISSTRRFAEGTPTPPAALAWIDSGARARL